MEDALSHPRPQGNFPETEGEDARTRQGLDSRFSFDQFQHRVARKHRIASQRIASRRIAIVSMAMALHRRLASLSLHGPAGATLSFQASASTNSCRGECARAHTALIDGLGSMR